MSSATDAPVPSSAASSAGATGPPEASSHRTERLASGLRWIGTWSWRWVGVAIAAAILGWLVGTLWVIVFPSFLAVIVASVLYPLHELVVRRAHLPRAVAATVVMVGATGLLAAAVAATAPSVSGQWDRIVADASQGFEQLRGWAEARGLISQEQIAEALDQAREQVRDSAGSLASGLLVGVTAVSSGLVTLVLTLVLTFLYLKDGDRFAPWVSRVAGRKVGPHLNEVLDRIWHTLGGFVRTQAIVSFVDAVLIGLALVLVGVPLAIPLAVLTFLGGFVPIIGAFVVGALAVLVALVSVGVEGALLVLLSIVVVQQVEGNLLQPWLQSRAMQLHAAVVVLAVTLGSSLFGIAGAFLAVPVAASVAVVLRYLSALADPADERSGPRGPDQGGATPLDGSGHGEAAEDAPIAHDDSRPR